MAQTQFISLADGREVAYQHLGGSSGPTLVHPPGGMVPIEVLEDDPLYERFLRTLAGYGNVIVYDHVGKGASDPFDPEADFVDQNADCFAAVVGACSLDRAWLIAGEVSGAPLVRRVALRHPDVLAGAAVLNPPGTHTRIDVDTALARDEASNEFVLRNHMPSRANDAAFRAWHERAGRLGGSATAARALWDAAQRSTPDVIADDRPLDDPPPFMVLARRERIHPAVLDWWCDRFPGAEVVSLDGDDAAFNAPDAELIADTIGSFIAGERRSSDESRPLLAILFLDLVDSARAVTRSGDTAWAGVLNSYEQRSESIIERHGGSVVKHTGDGTLATFATGSRAVAAARSVRSLLNDLDLEGRFGVHVGEVEARGDDIGGYAAHLAARVMAEAGPGQILATAIATGTLTGGPHRFEPVGIYDLRGIDQPHALEMLVDDHSAQPVLRDE